VEKDKNAFGIQRYFVYLPIETFVYTALRKKCYYKQQYWSELFMAMLTCCHLGYK